MMVALQVTLTAEQSKWLHDNAEALGVTIDAYLKHLLDETIRAESYVLRRAKSIEAKSAQSRGRTPAELGVEAARRQTQYFVPSIERKKEMPAELFTTLLVRGNVAEVWRDGDEFFWQWRGGTGYFGPFASYEECRDHLMGDA